MLCLLLFVEVCYEQFSYYSRDQGKGDILCHTLSYHIIPPPSLPSLFHSFVPSILRFHRPVAYYSHDVQHTPRYFTHNLPAWRQLARHHRTELISFLCPLLVIINNIISNPLIMAAAPSFNLLLLFISLTFLSLTLSLSLSLSHTLSLFCLTLSNICTLSHTYTLTLFFPLQLSIYFYLFLPLNFLHVKPVLQRVIRLGRYKRHCTWFLEIHNAIYNIIFWHSCPVQIEIEM